MAEDFKVYREGDLTEKKKAATVQPEIKSEPDVKEGESVAEEKNELKVSVANEMGFVAKRTKIVGNIKTQGHLTVAGIVNGDINAKGNVIVTGSVSGVINCNNLMVETERLTATVRAMGTVVVKAGNTLEGEVACKDITVAGGVTGSIFASDRIGLASTAVIVGDMRAAQIAVDFGAKIKGSMTIG